MRIEHSIGYSGGIARRSRPGSCVDPVLERVVDADAAERAQAIAKLEAVLAWAQAHPGSPDDCASWEPGLLPEGEDGLDHLGGPGTPAVAGFAVETLAARLGGSTGSAMQLVADTLDLAYRHPALWARVRAGACPVWVARRIAASCSALPVEAASWVDAQVGEIAGTRAWRLVEARIAYAVAQWDPERTSKVEAQARDGRHLALDLPGHGLTGLDPAGTIATAAVRGRVDVVDAVKFDALLTAQAAALGAAGDTGSLDVRRSRALGVIADQLLTGELDLDMTATGVGSESGSATNCLPATLFVHVNAEDLQTTQTGGTGIGVGTVERLGPATLDLLADWLRETDLHLRPVLDLGRTDAVDAHDPPEWMRELVIQRDRHCVFPHCGHDARGCDLDHIDPYRPPDRGGPPGQTRPENLAPLCRRHHRVKTFTRWHYRRLPSGSYVWTDPYGHTRTVTP
jgi:hypothetical protein